MASSSRNVPLEPLVDDFYFSALFDDDEILPISDEKYAIELALQEALMSAMPIRALLTPKVEIKHERSNILVPTTTIQTTPMIFREKRVKVEAGDQIEPAIVSSTTTGFCVICMDQKPSQEMFVNDDCSHAFCSDCIAMHVAAKIQENISAVKCPEPKCGSVLEPQRCRSVVPRQVFERWESALTESVVLGSRKLYCPFKDCSEMMVVDGGETAFVTVAECPGCHRLFCARCEVPWHAGTECGALPEGNKEKAAEKLVLDLAKEKKWRRCPGCEIFIEKNEGCSHISCRCGKEFCYICGSKWSSGHAC